MVSLSRAEYDVLLLTFSWVGGFLPLFLRRPGWTWTRSLGLALLLSPFVRMGLNLSLTFETLFVPTVLQPVSAEALWRGLWTSLGRNLLVPGLGLLLLHDALPRWRERRRDTPSGEDILRENGLGPKHSWRRDAQRGLALLFCIALAYALAFGLAAQLAGILSPGDDESRYWINITLPLIVLVSAAAGLTEEFLFRGVLLSRLARHVPFWLAAFAQAVLFGFIHAGYGSWTHVLGPFAFGLGMAWVVRSLGVLPAMLLHAQVNVVFFAFDVGPDYVAANGLAGIAGLAALLLALAAASLAALVATRADAVRILWSDLLSGARALWRLVRRNLRDEAEEEPAADVAPRQG